MWCIMYDPLVYMPNLLSIENFPRKIWEFRKCVKNIAEIINIYLGDILNPRNFKLGYATFDISDA